MQVLMVVAVFALGLFGFNRLMGYKKENRVFDFEDRYTDHDAYVKAILSELRKEGREASYQGGAVFMVDGNRYTLVERNVSIGPGILQPTILQPEK
ncbi:hypothetical protein [Salinicoccus sp. CNSTN-B1]